MQDEDKLDVGEWFYTSGEDRVFPRGFPVGTVISSQPGSPGQGMRDVKLNLSGQPGGAEAVLVVLEGIHQDIPAGPVAPDTHVVTLPMPPSEKGGDGTAVEQVQTEADKIVGKYQALGKDENHVYGAIGSNLPNFNPPRTHPSETAAQSTTAEPASAASRPLGSEPGVGAPAAPAPIEKTTLTKTASIPTPAHSAPVPAQTAPLPLGSPRRKPAAAATTPDAPKSQAAQPQL